MYRLPKRFVRFESINPGLNKALRSDQQMGHKKLTRRDWLRKMASASTASGVYLAGASAPASTERIPPEQSPIATAQDIDGEVFKPHFDSHSPSGVRVPIVAKFEDSAAYRWLNKAVLEHRVLDDMESLENWTTFTNGPEGVVDSRVIAHTTQAQKDVAEMMLTKERSREGRNSLRMRTPTKLDVRAPASGRGWGTCGVTRHFDGEDWRNLNRISLWIYPDCPGYYVMWLEFHLHNDGVEKLPTLFGQEGQNAIILRSQEWNHVVWEIGNVARDKITALEISYYMSGNEPEASDIATYYFDHLELERVEPDYIEGWDVWPGRISYSHAGYQTGASKSAIASGVNAKEFRLIDQETGETVLSKTIETVKSHLGSFQVMDFSEVCRPGSYALEAGGNTTRPFRIGPDIWRESIWKALNFFYSERCGMAIPGVHGVCHRDWQVTHGDLRIVVNGGWHDAGDLTQGLNNSGEVVYGIFSLAERLRATGEDPELCERLIEEARWGLDWILKTRFDDGFRDTGSVSSRRTNGILGDFDDVISGAKNEPRENFVASAAAAIAYRVLKESDPRWAEYSLKTAKADWRFAVEGMAGLDSEPAKEWWYGTFDSNNVLLEPVSEGVLASVDLWRATGDQTYADKAVELAQIILDSQRRKRPNWTLPLLGWFYTSPRKDRVLHYCHRGREQGPILALTRLCDAFPEHSDWMKWYSAVALYSEYLKAIANYTEPYGVMPSSIYRDDEYLHVPEGRKESFRQQVLNGVPLGEGHYLRLFPVGMDYRGHFGTILPKAQALTAAAHLRGNLQLAQLAERQLAWIIGRNPFAQSTMWGEGYDFTPLYSPLSGDMVGALPVGIQTRAENDVPYWPVQSMWTYKEVWVHPVGRWIWLMGDLAGPAMVEGEADSMVEFQDASNGPEIEVKPDAASGRFRVMLPEGRYTVRSHTQELTRTFLPGATYRLNLRAGRILDYEVSKDASLAGQVTIKVTARGQGNHRFALRVENLAFLDGVKELMLLPGKAGRLEWRARVVSEDTPWLAVVVPDGDVSQRKELMGAAWDH
jgi:Glycosyl hydrolase family 9/Cellulase N-terminal ig-like domain